MKYKTKLYLFSLGFTSFLLLGSLSVIVYQSRKFIFEQIQAQAIVIAAFAAINIDGDV